jgi:hypothetical protein
MNMHAPPPWKVSTYRVGDMIGIDGNHGATVAGAYALTDARLIAAAPDLYEALTRIANDGTERHALAIARAALAKVNT